MRIVQRCFLPLVLMLAGLACNPPLHGAALEACGSEASGAGTLHAVSGCLAIRLEPELEVTTDDSLPDFVLHTIRYAKDASKDALGVIYVGNHPDYPRLLPSSVERRSRTSFGRLRSRTLERGGLTSREVLVKTRKLGFIHFSYSELTAERAALLDGMISTLHCRE